MEDTILKIENVSKSYPDVYKRQVLKGVTEQFIKDPKGRVYCHKHPQGYWYPGGAGNVGGICLNQWFGEENFAVLNSRVPAMTPTGNVIYPLTMKGERFPFVNPEAEAFFRLRNEGCLLYTSTRRMPE